MRLVALWCAALMLPVCASAQTHPLVGEWKVQVAAGVRGNDGAPVFVNRPGSMSVKAQGDSLVATMELEPVAGVPKQTRRMVGKRVDGKVALAYQSEASLMGGGETVTRTATSTYTLEVKGDSLTGLISQEIGGVPGLRSQPMSGSRVR